MMWVLTLVFLIPMEFGQKTVSGTFLFNTEEECTTIMEEHKNEPNDGNKKLLLAMCEQLPIMRVF